MKEHAATVVLEGFGYLEGARWHDGALWCSDIPRGQVHRIDPAGPTASVVATIDGAKPSGLGFAPDGSLLIVTQADSAVRRLGPGGSTEIVADLSGVAVAANDMWVDASGRAYVTQIGYELFAGEEPRGRPLIVVEPTGEISTWGEGLVCPNGVGLSPDGRTVYVAETFAYRLTAFDIAADGSLGNQRVVKQFASLEEDALDGLCVDSEGAVWLTCPFSSQVRRVTPDGTVTDVVNTATPGHFVVSCALGGPNRTTLYLCTAETDMERMANNFEGTSRVEAVEVGVPG